MWAQIPQVAKKRMQKKKIHSYNFLCVHSGQLCYFDAVKVDIDLHLIATKSWYFQQTN